jgi:alkylation response protein AidB-like acyl-CoA dehydrogenase
MSAEVATRFDESDEAALLDAIDRWVERDLRPIVKEYDHADRYPAHIVEQMKELGLFGATIGAQYGGLGLPANTYARLVMRISSVWMSITGIFNSHLMLALAVEKFGTPEQKKRCDLEAGMAKYFSSEAALENSIESMRIHGAYGYSKEYDIERLYRDAPLTVIGEGTNEIQRVIIAKQWLKRNPVS